MAIYVANNGSLQTIKGIYECKDMLREGVDYIKGDWLSYNIGYNTSPRSRYGIVITFPYLINKIDYNLRNLQRWGNSHFVRFINSDGHKCALYTNHHGSHTIDVFDYNIRQVIKDPFGATFKLQDTNFHVENGVCSLFDQSFSFPYQMYDYDLVNSIEGGRENIGEISTIDCGEFAYYPCQLLTNIEQKFVGFGEHYAQGDCGFIGTDGKFYGYTGDCTLSVIND